MPLKISYSTHPGKKRELNEDSFSIFRCKMYDNHCHAELKVGLGKVPEPGEGMSSVDYSWNDSFYRNMKELFHDTHVVHLLTLADGMGGHKAGEVASAYIAKEFPFLFFNDLFKEKNMKSAAFKTVDKINREIHEMGESNEERYGNMGTTLTAALVDEKAAYIMNVGDSRTYMINKGGIKQITKDHSFVQALIDAEAINREEAREHPQRNIITRTIGTKPEVEPEIFSVGLEKGDIILLCSDGLTDMVDDEDIKKIILEHELNQASELLIEKANINGGKDNITVIIGEIE